MKKQTIDPFHAIADPSRRQILHLLSKNSLSINAVADNFDMSRPAVSKHIKILYSAGFITIEDMGRERYCTLNKEGFAALQEWVNYFERFWNEKLNALGKFLSDTQKPNKIRNTKRGTSIKNNHKKTTR